MAIRHYKPVTNGRRGMSTLENEEITTKTPTKGLLAKVKKSGGRNNQGKMTVRHFGGGAKRKYRIIDYKRDKVGVTGRARQGSIRAAQWRKGGIVFGPTPRDYTFKINRKERVLALKSALTSKLNEKKLIVVDSLKLNDLKTKTGIELLNNLKLTGKILFIASEDAENLYMSTRNLDNVLVLFPDEINVYDILNADYIVFDETSIKMVEEALN